MISEIRWHPRRKQFTSMYWRRCPLGITKPRSNGKAHNFPITSRMHLRINIRRDDTSIAIKLQRVKYVIPGVKCYEITFSLLVLVSITTIFLSESIIHQYTTCIRIGNTWRAKFFIVWLQRHFMAWKVSCVGNCSMILYTCQPSNRNAKSFDHF